MRKYLPYLELCKLRVVALMMLTTLIGMLLATPGWVPWKILVFGNLGIGLCACSAAVFNHILDQKIDSLMGRTQHRPLPTGRVTRNNAIYFACSLGVLGVGMLVTFVNTLTAFLTFLTIIGYACIYTMYLKRATPQNIVIGGAAGAAPPLLGWVAVTGHISPDALLLMLIIFVWTPPHFWSLAVYRYNEYSKANIPMLPVTHGIPFTKLNIFLYTLLLNAVSLLPYAVGMCGVIYLIGALCLGMGFIFWSLFLWTTQRERIALKTFRYSIYYLMLLFVVLLIDHYVK